MLSHIAIRLFKFHLFLNKLRFIYDISLTLKNNHTYRGKKVAYFQFSYNGYKIYTQSFI